MNQKHVWSIAQSAYLNLTATVNGQLQRVTYDASCNLISSYPLDWSPHDIIHDSIFKANWDSNGAKMTFYHQIPGKVSGILLADNKTKVDDGFFWIPLMYTLGRMVEYHGSDETRWLNNRDRLGFGLFNRTGDPTYGTFDVRGIPGGDMFLIGLSLVTGRDWRPVMDAYGIRTTDLARAQVQAHINSDRVWGGPMPVEYAVLEDDLYMFPTWNVSRVPIDTYAVWPRDSFTPQLCDATAGKTRTQTVTTTASKTRTTSTSATRTIATMALSITAKATSTPVVAPAGTEFIVNVAMPYACNVGSQGCGLEGFINIEAGQPRAWAGVQALGFSAVAVQNLTATQLSSRGVKAFNLNTTQIADLVGVCTSTQWQQGDCLFVVGVVDANSALRGAITLVADTQAPATSGQEFRVVRAVASADPSFASAADLRAELSNEVDRIKSLAQSSINDLYGNGSGGKLNNISIYPTHDAALYTISDSTMAWPVLFSNYENWNGNPALGNLLVPAGVTAGGAGGRFIAWPSSPFWLNVAGDAQKLLKNSLLWLNRGIDPASLLEDYIVVTAQLPGQSSYWFSYDTVTYNQMKSFYPRATIPTINSCDNSMLRGCLTNAKLLIIGNQMGKDGDSSAPNSTTNAAEVVTAVRDFLAAGGAVMYTHYSQNSNDLTTGLLGLMGLTFKSSNYWPRYGIQNGTFAVAAGNYTALDPCGSLRAAADTLGGTTPLVDADLASCYGVAANWEKCTNTNFTSKIGTALATVRSNIWSLESMGLPLFLRNGFTWLKLAVLLGDKYRTATSGDTPSSLYPVTRSNPHTFARAAFADASLAFLRAQGVRSASGGTLYCNRTAVLAGTCSVSLSTSVSTSTVFVSDALPASDDSVALDYFALPGVPFTIARNDSVNPNVSISVAFWPRMNLPGVFRLDGSNVTYFDRPAFANTILAGNSIPLLPGRSLTITVPYGAPLGLTFSSTGNVSSSPRPNYGVILSGVATIGEWNAAAGTSISKTVACTDYGVDQGTTAISTVVVGLASAPSDLTPTSCTFGTSNYAGNRTGAVFVGNTAYTDTATAAHFVCAAFESPYIKLITFKAVVSAGAGSISVVAAKYCSNTDASITKTSLISTSAMQNCWNTGSGGGYQLTGVVGSLRDDP